MATDPRVAEVVARNRAANGEPPAEVITHHQHDGALLVATVTGLRDAISGLACCDPIGPIIVLRVGLPPWQRREVFAHEIAHLVAGDQPRRDWHLRRNDEKAVRELRAEAIVDVLLAEFRLSDEQLTHILRSGEVTLSDGLVLTRAAAGIDPLADPP